jgi:hypothetical protein
VRARSTPGECAFNNSWWQLMLNPWYDNRCCNVFIGNDANFSEFVTREALLVPFLLLVLVLVLVLVLLLLCCC